MATTQTVVSWPGSRWEGNPKEKNMWWSLNEKDGVTTIVYYGKLWKTKKKEKDDLQNKEGLKSLLLVGKVLAPSMEWIQLNVVY